MKHTRLSLLSLLLAAGFGVAALPHQSASARPPVEVSTSIGFSLPRGAVYVSVADQPYYMHRGTYYRRTHHGYVVTRAPIGAVVRELPAGYERIDYRGQPYYRCDDIYYRPSRHGYVVVEAPAYVRHAAGKAQPPAEPAESYAGYRPVWVNQRELYIKEGQFFKKTPGGLAWVEPPLGGLAAQLPKGAVSVWYEDEEYFDVAGVYFRKTPSGYKVVESPWKAAE